MRQAIVPFLSLLGLAAGCALADGLGGEDETPASSQSNNMNNGNPNPSVGCDAQLSAPSACGGNVDGSWSAQDVCGVSGIIALVRLDAECNAITLVSETYLGVTGSFVASGTTFSHDVNIVVGISFDVDASYLEFQSCSDIGDIVLSDSSACIDVGNGCACDGTLNVNPVGSSSGTLSAANGVLTLDDGMIPTTVAYCAAADTMNIRFFIANPPFEGPVIYLTR